MRRLPLWVGLLLMLFNLSATAGINEDLNKYFNALGLSSNITAPHAYQGQTAGFYTGGSVFARNSVRNVQIAEVDLPSFRSGCGGIDLFTGGFSFINSQELVNSMKNILNNTVGYAFNLALESATPEIANAMKYMNTLAAGVNHLNINSCETAAGLVGSLWPRTHEAQQQICQDIGSTQGIFSDYAAARQGCGSGGQLVATLNRAQGPYKNLVLKNVNVAWKALQQNSFLRSDSALAEFFMSLSGTVIFNNPGNNDTSSQQYKVLASLAGDHSLLKALLHGGQARIYHCDDTRSESCLNPTLQSVMISPHNALGAQVKSLLDSMVNKIYTDTPLSDTEVGLLNATRLPVYKMLNVQAAFVGAKSVLDVIDYADVIATDILFQYLEESLSVIRTSSTSLPYPEALMSSFFQGISLARASIQEAKQSAYTQVTLAAQLIQQTEALEQMLAGSLSSQLNNTLQWATTLRQS
jgi:conjugative transfer pilus assembly protein TraH